jgi:hypothetical protein
MGWNVGIRLRGADKMVRKNKVSQNSEGINARAGSVIGNVAAGNHHGIALAGSASAVGNAVYGNITSGFFVFDAFSGTVAENNTFGNGACGLLSSAPGGVVASNNYWGAATGPGADPADDVCDSGTITVVPFATKPFKVKAKIKL